MADPEDIRWCSYAQHKMFGPFAEKALRSRWHGDVTKVERYWDSLKLATFKDLEHLYFLGNGLALPHILKDLPKLTSVFLDLDSQTFTVEVCEFFLMRTRLTEVTFLNMKLEDEGFDLLVASSKILPFHVDFRDIFFTGHPRTELVRRAFQLS